MIDLVLLSSLKFSRQFIHFMQFHTILIPPVKCLDLGEITNGAKDPPAGPYDTGDEVTFTCAREYQLTGHSKIQCGVAVTGEWNEPPPTCIPMGMNWSLLLGVSPEKETLQN